MSDRKTPQLDDKQSTDLFSRKNKIDINKTQQKYVDRTLGCRHEIKYIITESKAQALARFIHPYLQPDRYSKLQRSGCYPIVSLYLDSDSLQLARETMTGKTNRYKLRIRGYTDEPEYPCFLEIKRRVNTIIIKSRSRIMHDNIENLLSGMSLPPQDYTIDEESLKQFQFYMKSINARPMILVRYMRQAFESSLENRVRVTFDRELCYKVTRTPEVKIGGTGWQHHSYTLGKVILEIKFTARYPGWLNQMVKTFDLRQESVSKYATSIQQSHILGFCAPQLGGNNDG